MARKPRIRSRNGIYLIYLDWAEKVLVIKDSTDFDTILRCLKSSCEKYNCEIYAYAFNKKYAGLILREHSIGNCSRFIQGFLSVYSSIYNKKYSHNGKTTKDRFKSIPIENISLLPPLSAYIHNLAENDLYSSKNEYFSGTASRLCETKTILALCGNSKSEFAEIHAELSEIPYEFKHDKKITDKELKNLISNIYNINPSEIKKLPKNERDKILGELRKNNNITICELQRITGISRGIITRSTKDNISKTIKPKEEIWLL